MGWKGEKLGKGHQLLWAQDGWMEGSLKMTLVCCWGTWGCLGGTQAAAGACSEPPWAEILSPRGSKGALLCVLVVSSEPSKADGNDLLLSFPSRSAQSVPEAQHFPILLLPAGGLGSGQEEHRKTSEVSDPPKEGESQNRRPRARSSLWAGSLRPPGGQSCCAQPWGGFRGCPPAQVTPWLGTA